MVKVKIPLPPDAPFGGEAEWVWADELGNGTYRIRNVPFFAKGLSFGDLIQADFEDGVPVFRAVSSRGGHSTYRIFASSGRNQPDVKQLLGRLRELHCDIEVATGKLIAIDVLPEADIYRVYTALEEAERSGIIDFQEGHCGHELKH